MLKGISPLVSPDLLYIMSKMGHGDEIVLSDAHFPAYTYNSNVIRADGINVSDLLEAILPLFELDSYVPFPVAMMAAVQGDNLDPLVEKRYLISLQKTNKHITEVERIDRFAFYERTKTAFAVVVTGETAKYGNVILKKGVVAL